MWLQVDLKEKKKKKPKFTKNEKKNRGSGTIGKKIKNKSFRFDLIIDKLLFQDYLIQYKWLQVDLNRKKRKKYQGSK